MEWGGIIEDTGEDEQVDLEGEETDWDGRRDHY